MTKPSVQAMIQAENLSEVTTSLKLSQPITQVDLAAAYLTDAELEACVKEQLKIVLKGKVSFTANRQFLDILYEIAKPEAVNNGLIQIKKQPYFRWSTAKPIIVKKYELTDINYVGNRNKITGLRISSILSTKEAHRQKIAGLIRRFKVSFPHIQMLPETCVKTTACNIEEKRHFELLLGEKE